MEQPFVSPRNGLISCSCAGRGYVVASQDELRCWARCGWFLNIPNQTFTAKLNDMKVILLISTLLFSSMLTYAQTNSAVLKAGDPVPDVKLRTEDDKEVSLRKLVSEKPTVLIFYRGGWCPYCNRHLQDLVGIEKDLEKAGAQLVAISMDQPSKLKATPDREQLHYQLLSDSDALAAKAFGVAFKVEDALVKKYKDNYKIDLEAASGRKHHILPHPAVFVADDKGEIQFAHYNPDYKVRLKPAKVLEAVKTASDERPTDD